MKGFFSRNKKGVEIFFTLALVLATAGYYYLIYIPDRENEIIERRFRTLQRIEANSRQKVQGYMSTIKNCMANIVELSKEDSFNKDSIVNFYKIPGKFAIEIERIDSIDFKNKLISVFPQNAKDSIPDKNFGKSQGFKFPPDSSGRNLIIKYDTVLVYPKYKKHYCLKATINNKEFIIPLLRENVFDHYIVFNNSKNIYEDFYSGFSYENIDSLFNSKDRIYSSRIVKIETGGEKYLAFLHPCGYNNKNDRIIAGLLSQKAFDKEKRKLPEKVVTIILFIALFSLLLIPVLKLSLMGKKERISINDLLFNYISMMLLISIVLLLFLRYNNNFLLPDKTDKNSKKDILASQISGSLNNEIESAYNFLDSVDLYYAANSMLQNIHVKNLSDTAKPGRFSKRKNGDYPSLLPLDSVVKSLQYKNAFRIFWINKPSGREKTNWSYFDDPPGGSLKDRNYFKNIIQNKTFSLSGNPSKQYFIEPVISWNDGSFKVVISKSSRIDTLVAAVSCNFTSVVNPVLPLGYSFAITNKKGEVIFHSDTTHNLNENLLNEIIDPEQLKIALRTKTQQEFTSYYEEQPVSTLVQPVAGLNYFIIIFYNEAYNSSQNANCLSFTFTMLFSLFLFICIEMMIIFLCYCRHSKLLKNKFDFSWLHPFKSGSVKYFFVFLFNSGLFILLFFFCAPRPQMNNLVDYIFLFLISSVLSSIVSCLVQPSDQSMTLKKANKKAIGSLIILAIIVLIASSSYSAFLIVISFTFLSIVLFVILYLIFRKEREIKPNRYLINFRLMIFSKLLLTSSIPIAVFFICSYNFEEHLNARLKLFDYAENIKKQVLKGNSLDALISQVKNPDVIKNFYTDTNWIHKVDTESNPVEIPYDSIYNTIDAVCIDLLKTNRVHYNDISYSTEKLEIIKPFENDSNVKQPDFVFNSILRGTSDTLKYKISEIKNNTARQQYVTLSSSGSMEYYVPMPSITNLAGLVFWLLLSGCGVLIYQLIKYSSGKIYGVNIPEIDDFREINRKLISDKNIKHLFVQGIPGSRKTEYLRTVMNGKEGFIFRKEDKDKKNNVCLFDLIQIPDEIEFENEKARKKENAGKEEDKKNKTESEVERWNRIVDELYQKWLEKDGTKCIIFNHFEYKILDEHTNRTKFNLLEKFMVSQNENKIIITSNIDPVEFIHSLQKYELAPLAGKENNAAKKDERNSLVNDGAGQYGNAVRFENIHRWINMLGMFTNIYSEPFIGESNGDDKKYIPGEYRRNINLIRVGNDFKDYNADSTQTIVHHSQDEDCILKIQSYSEHSYRYIWSSLTREEQLALYDLAEDGLMNTTNYISLTMLLNKGLIRRTDGKFAMMNRSFRNFVLTIVTSNEIKNIEKEINDGHTWKDYKYPVMIVLGALLYFALSSNPEKFGNVLPVISGIMAGIPTIIKLLSYLRPGETKS